VLLEAVPTQTTSAASKDGIPVSAGEQRAQILQQQGNRGKQLKAAEEAAAPGKPNSWPLFLDLGRHHARESPLVSLARPSSDGMLTWYFRISGHYQWVIFLVVMVVAIVGIWVGACIWRKRYLRNKDRQYALGTNLARATESGRVVAHSGNSRDLHPPSAGMFDPAPISSAGVYDEKPKKGKKKWMVGQRT
jgi:hypothetical protein